MKKYFKSFIKKISPAANTIENKKVNYANTELYNKNNLLHNFYTILNQINFIPRHIVDVGANHGNWTREVLKYFPDSYYTLLEPQHQMQSSIRDILETNSKVTFHAVGAGDTQGTFTFTIADRHDSCSFIYSKEEAANKGFKQIEIPVVTLNDFLPKTNYLSPDIIKIDAEGLDLEVLTGADNFFGITEIFMVEASVMNKSFKNSVLNIMIFMDGKGYRLFDFTDLNRTIKHKALWLVEMVFIKKDGIIDNAISSYT